MEGTSGPIPCSNQVAQDRVQQFLMSPRIEAQQPNTFRGMLVCVNLYSNVTGIRNCALIFPVNTPLRKAILVTICPCLELSEKPPCPGPSVPPALAPPVPSLLCRDDYSRSCLWVLLPLSRTPRHFGHLPHCSMKGHSYLLADLLNFLWDCFLKQLQQTHDYEPSTDIHFLISDEEFSIHPQREGKQRAG